MLILPVFISADYWFYMNLSLSRCINTLRPFLCFSSHVSFLCCVQFRVKCGLHISGDCVQRSSWPYGTSLHLSTVSYYVFRTEDFESSLPVDPYSCPLQELSYVCAKVHEEGFPQDASVRNARSFSRSCGDSATNFFRSHTGQQANSKRTTILYQVK